LERRCYFPALPEARLIGHSEEHLILASPQADQVRLGQPLLAIPGHVCPTCALFDYADVVRAGRVTERWAITARAR
jgi:D-serine deaminase-like pyridoxal phosphate-dependent protein